MSEWIEWHGGECPVGSGTCIVIRLRDGREMDYVAGFADWSHTEFEDGMGSDIVAYRIVEDNRYDRIK